VYGVVGNSARKFGGENRGHCCIGQPGQLSMDLATVGMGIVDLVLRFAFPSACTPSAESGRQWGMGEAGESRLFQYAFDKIYYQQHGMSL
jgi:hypothetical protein